MTETFKELFEQSLEHANLFPGATIKAHVLNINSDYVTLNAGLKSEGLVPTSEFCDNEGNLEIKEGDWIDVILDSVEDGYGETILSREKAKRQEAWQNLQRAHDNRETVTGLITGRVKGGFTVEIGQIRAFLPGSLVDLRPTREASFGFESEAIGVKVIKMDMKRNNIVVSRRAVVEEENSAERQALLGSLHEGLALKGVVKNLTDYGAFVDLGGIDGLLHITDISWRRVKHPSEALSVGQEVMVKILSFDRERNRVSLGIKQLEGDPWGHLVEKYPSGTRLKGKVTNITDYGCFVEVEPGIEGLVHMSEMDWTNKNVHPNKVVQLGEEVEVMVLEIDEERRRISLGMKQCRQNPWQAFAEVHKKNEKISGKIRSITDFGIFLGLDGNIDGLVHVSDLSWKMPGEEAVKLYKKGQEVEAMILAIDADRERVSLGIKQLESDLFSNYADQNPKGTIVKGKVTQIDARSILVELELEVIGTIKASDLSIDKVDDPKNIVNIGDELEAKIINIDKKMRTISLSVKAKDVEEQAEALRKYGRESEAASGTLGDLLKDKMGSSNETNT